MQKLQTSRLQKQHPYRDISHKFTSYKTRAAARTPMMPTAEPATWRTAALGVLVALLPPLVLLVLLEEAVAAEMMARAASDSTLEAALWARAVWVLKKAATLLVPPAMALERSLVMADHPEMLEYLLWISELIEETAPVAWAQLDPIAAVASLMWELMWEPAAAVASEKIEPGAEVAAPTAVEILESTTDLTTLMASLKLH
ncbi:hypothetical protein FN846DRAFT_929306 [Sphaerosporella brunnea]|uniref:Uncharacterized protein n=1 Tax=Sphaerosporella brunnea TaxID=1250544 RepID=A0A5J5F8V5_9PEZI|nr:hypothetical protein FN846DRAFT_929306 [Sphaerosporella brunnea]